MKKILIMVLVLAMVFSLAGCGGSNNEANDKPNDKATNTNSDVKNNEKKEPADKPADSDVSAEPLVFNRIETSNITSLTTWLATDEVSFNMLGNINSGLYTLGEGGVPILDMAESVDISDDGLTYTFKLRDANWSTVDGEIYAPVTAHDFVFAWKKLLEPEIASQYSFMITTIALKNGKEAVELQETLVGYKAAENNLIGLEVSAFEDIDGKTAKEQYDEAVITSTEKVETIKADLIAKYGSVDGAYAEIQKLIDSLGVTAPDDKTLVLEITNPVPFLIDLMAFPSFYPASEKFYNEQGDAYAKSVDSFLYNGAYIFKEWKISERHLIEKNPNYWDAKTVSVDKIDWRVIEGISNDTSVQMYLDGEILNTLLSGENVEKYGNRPDMVSIQDTTLFYLEINQNKGEMTTVKKLLSDVRARKALNMAIEKSYITDVIYANGSLPTDYLIPKGFVGSKDHDNKGWRQVAGDLYDGELGYNRYNVEEAVKLWNAAMADLGLTEVEIELLIFQGDSAAKVGTHIQNELEKNLPGLKVIVQALPFSEKLKRVNEGTYSLNWGGWGPDYPDAMTFMDMWVTGGGHNSVGYSNEEYDAIIDSAKSGELTNPAKSKERFEALVKAEKILLEDDQVIIPLYQRSKIGLRDPKVENYFSQGFGPDIIYKWVTFK